MKKFLFLIIVLMNLSLSAQLLPDLFIESIDKAATINTLDIEVDIQGNIAETTLDILFYNPNNSVVEGELIFPLNDKQEVVNFYLEVNGNLREASIVEKEKGRVAYEATIRQNIDPGLIEKRADNSFKARVFPIPPEGYKRIKIVVLEELKPEGYDFIYKLPAKKGVTIPNFSLKATNYGDKAPVVSNSLEFSKWQNSYVLEFSKTNYTFDREISFRIPGNNTQSWVEDDYFYAVIDTSDLFFYKQNRMAPKPKSITVLWDVSSSIEIRDMEEEYNYLTSYLSQLNGQSSVKIIPFNIDRLEEVDFKARDSIKIVKYLKGLKPDGGTRLSSLNLDGIKGDSILLFSDGVSTFDRGESPKLSSIPIDTITSSYKSNNSLLRYLSIKTGGNFIELNGSPRVSRRPNLIKVEGKGVEDIYTDLEVSSHRFSIAGKLLSHKGEIDLTFRKEDGIEVVYTIDIDDKSNRGINIDRLWAIKKIDNLDLLYDENRDEITQTGKEFGIVTRNTSLIVLDRVEDYVTYEIEPPAELKKEWDSLISQKRKASNKNREDSLNEALNAMRALKDWWDYEYPKDRPEPPVIDKIAETSSSSETPLRSNALEEMVDESYSEREAPEEFGMSMSKKEVSEDGDINSIVVEGWVPDAPYFKELKDLKGDKLLARYYKIRDNYKNRPSFFVDVASLLYDQGMKDMAKLVISNILEMNLEEPELIRITIYLLEKFGFVEEAYILSFKLMDFRGEEPQTYRDIANLALLNREYQIALDYYYKVLLGEWDDRFNGVKSVVLNEMNYLIDLYGSSLNLKEIDSRLIYPMPLGVRAVISWSSDNNDIDLWVKDPYGEDCGYSNKSTYTGGKLSSDFTGGYGPEEFSIKEPLYGSYIVDINYFSEGRMSVSGPVTIKVDLYKNYGKGLVKETVIRRLEDVKERITIGEVKF